LSFATATIQVRGFAPIGMLEYWDTGMMGTGLRLVELTLRPVSPTGWKRARRGFCKDGLMAKFVLIIKFKMDNIL
jgi:hypothetical protein